MDKLDEFLEALTERVAQRTKAASSTPTGYYAHGQGGLLSGMGLRPEIVNAMVMPRGLEAKLGVMLSVYSQERRAILTGQTASTGSNPTTACGDAKVPGNLKICNQTWPFGRFPFDSTTIQVDRLGELLNRSEFIDHALVGNPFALGGVETPLGAISAPDAFRSEKAKRLLEMFIGWRLEYAHVLFDGNPVNTAGSAGYIEPFGLESIVNDGYRDSITGVACPAADSLVIDMNNVVVNSNGSAVVDTLVEAYNSRRYLSEGTGLAPVKFAFVGRRSLFHALTAVWPCTYATYRCQTTGSASDIPLSGLGMEMNRMRDEMRRGEYLLIDGEQVPFVIDDSLAETIPVAGTFAGELFLLPMESPLFGHTGGKITYIEAFDMRNPVQIANEAPAGYPSGSFIAAGNGRFLVWPKAPQNVCIGYGMLCKHRVIVEAPFLAARFTNIRYIVQQHERSPFASDSYYHVDGGQYTFDYDYNYSPTA